MNQYLGGDATLDCSAETQTRVDELVAKLVKQHEKARLFPEKQTPAQVLFALW